MTTTISDGDSDIAPRMVTGYRATVEIRHRVHEILEGGDAVSLVSPSLRRGELRCLCTSKAQAFALKALLEQVAIFTLTDSDHTELDMTFVTEKDLTIELDDRTRDEWLVSFGFREVPT